MTRRLLASCARWATSALLLAATVFLCTRLLPANPTTVAVTLLLLVLVLAAWLGFRYAAATAIAAALCFNYYFLPPVGTFAIAQGQDWAALFAFLATALIASNLSDRIRRQAAVAEASRRELECLYDFSQRLLATSTTDELLRAVPLSIVAAFSVRAAAFYVAEGDALYIAGPVVDNVQHSDPALRDQLREAMLRRRRDLGPHVVLLPVSVGVRPIGSVRVEAGTSDREDSGDPAAPTPLPALSTLEAMTALIAISIERTRAMDRLARVDAARESEQLRSALLDSVTHDLRTPLTSIKASVTALQHARLNEAQRAELLSVIDEESDRLNELIARATEMAALDAHSVSLQLVPCSVAAVVEAAIEERRLLLRERQVACSIPADLPPVLADEALFAKVLTHLIENAAKYSIPDGAIRVGAAADPRYVTITVADDGPGIDPTEHSLIFEKFYRGRDRRYGAPGSGMGLAICRAILKAHEGRISVQSSRKSGSTFSVTLRRADREAR